MKTKQPPPERSAVSIRQQRYRQRMEEAGFRRATLWLHQNSEQHGFERGLRGESFSPVPEGLDQLSYCTGWILGAGEQQMPIFCTCCQNQLGHGVARDYYDLFTMRPYELSCDECVPLIEAEKK
jgi:hypothetical protein